jgi:hypothetical protein
VRKLHLVTWVCLSSFVDEAKRNYLVTSYF